MNKYIRGGICASVTLVKFAFLKLIRGKDFHCKWINNCSPFSGIEVNKGGKLAIGNKFKLGSYARIRVRQYENKRDLDIAKEIDEIWDKKE